MSTIYSTESWALPAKHIDQTFHIDVALPAGYSPDAAQPYPLVYVLDGNLAFHLAATSAMLCSLDLIDPGLPSAIVVGIGYPQPDQASVLRVRDLTPPNCVDDWFADFYTAMAGFEAENGGAPAFLDFIQDELHREVTARYPVTSTAAILGDSYGGLFTYYALTERAPQFDRYWLGSPGLIGCGTHLLARLAPLLADGFDVPTKVCLTLGSAERTGTINGALQEEIYRAIAGAYDQMLTDFTRAPVTNLEFDAREFENETHTSVLPVALTHAWRFLMRR